MCLLILDAGPLITSCRFGVANRLIVDHLLDLCRIAIARSVYDEVVIAGSRHPDAAAARHRVESGQIVVLPSFSDPQVEILIAPYGLGRGERESILLTGHPDLKDAVLVIDDHLGYLVSDRLGRRKRLLLDVIADLVKLDRLDVRLALDMIHAVRTRYPTAFVEHSVRLLQR